MCELRGTKTRPPPFLLYSEFLSSEKQFYLGNDRNQKHTQFQPIGNFIVYGCSASVIAAWRGFFSSHVGSFWPVTALAIFRVDSPITVIAVGWLVYVS